MNWLDALRPKWSIKKAQSRPPASFSEKELMDIACDVQGNCFMKGEPGHANAKDLTWSYDPNYPVVKLGNADEWKSWYKQERKWGLEDYGNNERYDNLEKYWEGKPDDPIVIFENKGKGYIWDGNHRAAISIIRGWPTIPAIVGRPKPIRNAQLGAGEKFGPLENPANFGTPAVNISDGEPSKVFAIPGVKGSIQLNVGIEAVKEALEKAFGGDFFYPITGIVVKPLPGKFGETSSDNPHTIEINEAAIIDAVKKAVSNEAMAARQKGIEAEFTPEIGRRIETEIAKLLWEVLPHERAHAIDFQAELRKQHGNLASVPESHGEAAGKAALSRFRWYAP